MYFSQHLRTFLLQILIFQAMQLLSLYGASSQPFVILLLAGLNLHVSQLVLLICILGNGPTVKMLLFLQGLKKKRSEKTKPI